ncbi:MAG: exodeoxyribonuclease VII large subunit [Coriobacteriales bacterium]
MSEEQQGQEACTVSQAMEIAKRGLESIFLTVVGEISEFSDKPGYKAIYFTVRDDNCAMPCLMWRNVYSAAGVELAQGMLVQLTGNFSCYPAKGRMQFSVRKIQVAGEGNLRMRVAQLAQRLQAEGLMDPSRKRRTLALPKRIAVITSPRGKAIKDVMRTLRRRYPLGELLVYGVPVEGADAPRHMCRALAEAQATVPAPDVILLVRGGGSYEDLMPFNDEALARAVAACTIPVVTGIGHEPDNSIADMVADRRCSTPTAAAEAIAPSVEELSRKVENATRALNSAYAQRIEGLEHRLARLQDRPLWHDQNYLLGSWAQGLDMASERLGRALPALVKENSAQLSMAELRLRQAIPNALAARSVRLGQLQRALQGIGGSIAAEQGRKLALAAARLDALSPLKTLSRGYSIAYSGEGPGIVKSVEGIVPGSSITLRVEDGSLGCTVNSVTPVGSSQQS